MGLHAWESMEMSLAILTADVYVAFLDSVIAFRIHYSIKMVNGWHKKRDRILMLRMVLHE